jgi:uncharacterized low-complexity protein
MARRSLSNKAVAHSSQNSSSAAAATNLDHIDGTQSARATERERKRKGEGACVSRRSGEREKKAGKRPLGLAANVRLNG